VLFRPTEGASGQGCEPGAIRGGGRTKGGANQGTSTFRLKDLAVEHGKLAVRRRRTGTSAGWRRRRWGQRHGWPMLSRIVYAQFRGRVNVRQRPAVLGRGRQRCSRAESKGLQAVHSASPSPGEQTAEGLAANRNRPPFDGRPGRRRVRLSWHPRNTPRGKPCCLKRRALVWSKVGRRR
jgi:hypothetical protein